MGKYSDYEQMKEDDRILREFPGLSKEDLEKANNFFEHYLFFENVKGGRKVWTSCCHHRGEIWESMPRTQTQEHRVVSMLEHNDVTQCPYCHREVRAKNAKKIGTAKRLEQYIPILFLHPSRDGETMYAQGYWAWKSYGHEERWASPPFYMVTRVFRFRRGEWKAWCDHWVHSKNECQMCREDTKWIGEPFTRGNGMMISYCGYKVIGLERLADSFLRYTGVRERYEGRGLSERLVSTLALASLYPEGVEMLLKAGMTGPIDDWIWRRKKNAKTIKWGETDPRKVFDLNGCELKEFLAGDRNLEILEIYKVLRKSDRGLTIGAVRHEANRLGMLTLKDIAKVMKKMPKLTMRRLIPYFDQFTGPRCHGMGNMRIHDVARTWIDYINFAIRLGYDLKNPVIQTPRNLDLKHTEAHQAVEVLEAEARRAEAEALKAEELRAARSQDEGVRGRVKGLTKRYSFETEHYLIRPPGSAVEIVEEGRALSHCVGGYVSRHASGSCTILFLRNRAAPDVPLCTIEMRGEIVVQIHGYRNDIKAEVSPKVRYAEILDPWLVWVKAGSKRTKDGKPKAPKKKKEVNVA